MPEYKFSDNQAKTKAGSNGQSGPIEQSTRQIPVEDGNIHFHLGAKPAKPFTGEIPQQSQPQASPQSEKSRPNNVPVFGQPETYPLAKPDASNPAKQAAQKPATKAPINHHRLLYKFWHGLEFVAVTAAIFMLLFFVINFESYSQLFLTKLDQLRGQINVNPYTQQEQDQLKTASPEGQKPLPIVNNSQAAKKQIPELNLAVAPPDDRIIIPRIGQNVPVIRVPTDMLLRKDWAALEKQIQEALRYGVVHFPGTAYPGDDGNVVITGHSSYFPWDPGRFKDVFALLHQVDVGDKVVVYHEQKKFEYLVYEKKVVKPSQVEVLTQGGENRLTLITCTPVGTDLNRLVVLARPVSVK